MNSGLKENTASKSLLGSVIVFLVGIMIWFFIIYFFVPDIHNLIIIGIATVLVCWWLITAAKKGNGTDNENHYDNYRKKRIIDPWLLLALFVVSGAVIMIGLVFLMLLPIAYKTVFG